jgi:hypothetical protein
MAWIIDKDCLDEVDCGSFPKSTDVGTMGPRSFDGDTAKLIYHFRMLDDDEEVCYEGRCDSCDDDNALGPLDDFGMPNAGCTIIQYLESDGCWRNLN